MYSVNICYVSGETPHARACVRKYCLSSQRAPYLHTTTVSLSLWCVLLSSAFPMRREITGFISFVHALNRFAEIMLWNSQSFKILEPRTHAPTSGSIGEKWSTTSPKEHVHKRILRARHTHPKATWRTRKTSFFGRVRLGRCVPTQNDAHQVYQNICIPRQTVAFRVRSGAQKLWNHEDKVCIWNLSNTNTFIIKMILICIQFHLIVVKFKRVNVKQIVTRQNSVNQIVLYTNRSDRTGQYIVNYTMHSIRLTTHCVDIKIHLLHLGFTVVDSVRICARFEHIESYLCWMLWRTMLCASVLLL